MSTIAAEHFASALRAILSETFEEFQGIFLDRQTSLLETLAGISAAEASIPVPRWRHRLSIPPSISMYWSRASAQARSNRSIGMRSGARCGLSLPRSGWRCKPNCGQATNGRWC